MAVLSCHDSLNHYSAHEIRLLDTIAVSLTSGREGDVVAAAFDCQREHDKIKLVLAKNDTPTAAARCFIGLSMSFLLSQTGIS